MAPYALAIAGVMYACSSKQELAPPGGSSSGTTTSGGGNAMTGSTTSGAGAGSTSQGGAGTGGASSGGAGGTSAGGANAGGANAGGTGGVAMGAGGINFNYDPVGGAGGTETCAATEVKGKKAPVDIVMAIDTSGSMAQEIAQVKANINGSFADVLGQGGLDYRLAFIAAKGTGTFQMCVAPPLGGPNCGNNPPIFKAVTQTVASTNALSLFLSTYDNANPALNWQNFVRFDAVKALVVITDDNSALAANTFDTQLLAKLPSGMFGTAMKRKYLFYGIIGIDKNNPALTCATAVNNGSVYQSLVTLTKGAQFSECEADYSPVFKALANNVIGQLSCDFVLPLNDPNGKAIDPQQVAVKYVDAMSNATPFPRVNDASKCAGVGWYYEDNNNPSKILLCPAACTQVQSQSGGEVKIDVGCLKG